MNSHRSESGSALPQTYNVLLVEDTRSDFIQIQSLLAEVGRPRYELDWAPSYQMGLERIHTRSYDALLLDGHLVEASGLQLLRAVRNARIETPVIFLTGASGSGDDSDALEAGAADFLLKSELTAGLLDRTIRYCIERQRLVCKLEKAAYHDPLTGLANRRQFSEQLAHALARAERADSPLALMQIDLDRFKDVNDQLGHEAGDAVLTEIADILRGRMRGGDIVARLGGDEFSVVLEALKCRDDAVRVAESVIDLIESHDFGAATRINLSASIGIAFPDANTFDADELLRAADTAMYEAKRAGRGRVRLFEERMQRKAVRKASIRSRLTDAVANDELRLEYQPLFSMRDGCATGAEALVRWNMDLNDLAPSEFIPIAEETGAIHSIGEWVLDTAASQLSRWQTEGRVSADFTMGVNVSPVELLRPDITSHVRAALDRYRLNPPQLELEITETTALRESQQVADNLNALRDLGVKLALDDFGTGHSSLSYLTRLHVDTLKIDKSFTARCTDNAEHGALVKATLGIASSLGLHVVAEGVETLEQRRYMTAQGCTVGQGYLFERPSAVPRLAGGIAQHAVALV